MTKNLTCISCPLGCSLEVELSGDIILRVSGHECPRGHDYAIVECTAPMRMVTTTVPITGGSVQLLPVRTRHGIPKDKIMACIEALRGVVVDAPVDIGDVILADAAGCGVDIIATRRIARVKNA